MVPALVRPQPAALATAWSDLQRARAAQAAKDTPTNRAAVQAALTAFDTLFDTQPH